MCVWSGQPLAKLEFAIMITTLLRHYDIEVRVCIGVSCFVVCCAITLRSATRLLLSILLWLRAYFSTGKSAARPVDFLALVCV